MKAKLLGLLGTGKKKAGIIALCAALVLTLGTTTALAANAVTGGKLFRLDNGKASYSVDGGQTWNEGTPADGDFHYSLDGGKTWSDGLPPAGSENTLVANGKLPDGAENSSGVAVKNVDGVMQYSVDGGKTWSENIPDGVEIAEDGSIQASFENASGAGMDMSLVKVECGVAYHSIDGGKTWSEGLAAGDDTSYSLDGGNTWNNGFPPAGSGEQSLVAHGAPPAEGDANSFMAKNENGVISYSGDGGKTWSNTAPDGFHTD